MGSNFYWLMTQNQQGSPMLSWGHSQNQYVLLVQDFKLLALGGVLVLACSPP